MEDIRLEGRASRLGTQMTAVVVDGQNGKEYRLPVEVELEAAEAAAGELDRVYAEIPFGLPNEPLPSKEALGFRVPLYGFDKWSKLFTPRQLLALGGMLKSVRRSYAVIVGEYPPIWSDALFSCIVLSLERYLDFANMGVQWKVDVPTINHSLVRFALPISWDFAEGNPLGLLAGSFTICLERIAVGLDTYQEWKLSEIAPTILNGSAMKTGGGDMDLIITDPPYYDAIPYSDLMDFFYVWLRRTLWGTILMENIIFQSPLSPKWDHDSHDGELIDDSSRFNGDVARSKSTYEDGMFRAFQRCHDALKPDGRLVIVFAHKQPDAWETLVSAVIRAGFVVDASWPIQTEQVARMRAQSSAALSSSVWLVCKKRDAVVRPGWDSKVLEGM
jgi:adenine-specific DNA methylase